MNLNGRCSILSSCFKIGALGSKVDNIRAGGVIVGINSKGNLDKYGFLFNGEVMTEINGKKFSDIRIPEFKKIEELALLLHSRIEHIHIIGWDLALDLNNDAVLIEANATWPGITIEQLCTGPIFGDRTQEVIEYCKSKCGISLF